MNTTTQGQWVRRNNTIVVLLDPATVRATAPIELPDGSRPEPRRAAAERGSLALPPRVPRPLPLPGWEFGQEEESSVYAAVPLPEVNSPLGEGIGLYCAKPASRRYGLVETILALTQIGMLWWLAYPGGPRIRIGDVSKQGGGSLPPHGSHRLGIDVDIGLIRRDGGRSPVNFATQPAAYDRERTQELVNTIRANGVLRVDRIWFADRQVQNADHDNSHYDHMHVRFCVPARYDLASMIRRAFPGGTKGVYRTCA